MQNRLLLFLVSASLLMGCETDVPPPPAETPIQATSYKPIPTIGYHIVAELPHGKNSFTEGLQWFDGRLYESTGSPSYLPETRTILGPIDSASGEIEVLAELNRNKFFGEGMVILNGKVYQLTYQSRKGFIYDLETGKNTRTFQIPCAEGWGLTTDGTSLIMSDGSSTLRYLDPSSLKVTKELEVTEHGASKTDLNELEYVKGFMYANVYTTDEIIKIDLKDGKVVGSLKLSNLVFDLQMADPTALELNGIAYDEATNFFYITGKMWPKIYQMEFFE